MSLVAYAPSSDEESDCDDDQEIVQLQNPAPTKTLATNGHISDDDEDYAPVAVGLQELKKPSTFTLTLPKPKNAASFKDIDDELNAQITPTFAKLPMPKSTNSSNTIIEEDDEFLHKKATPLDVEAKENPSISQKGPVKISIPSLAEFNDVDAELAAKSKPQSTRTTATKKCGLLSILPKAKSEQNFAKAPTAQASTSSGTAAKPTTLPFVPDTVKNRRPAQNTESVDGIKLTTKNHRKSIAKPKIALVDCSDSDESDEDAPPAGDFFSLNTDEQLPDVSVNEINAMVAKRAAKMAEVTSKYLSSSRAHQEAEQEKLQQESEFLAAQKRRQEPELDQRAMEALVGSSAKRRRKEQDIQIMDISSEEVLPNRDEWMRTALATSTAYQPTGVLVDEEPVAGTRRKHQITYLAHKAKANEAELQAMWAANRQNRRATQSKYGF